MRRAARGKIKHREVRWKNVLIKTRRALEHAREASRVLTAKSGSSLIDDGDGGDIGGGGVLDS